MDEENQNNSSADIANLGVKRKRGRPRKDDASGSDSAKRRSRKNEHSSQDGNVLVGQSVSGVLDGSFDSGYMLTVTVGNTGPVLTGVVFEPDCSVLVSAENDIAPNVEMLKRLDISIPSTGQLDQPKPSKDEVTIHPKGSSLSPVPCNLNFRPTPSALSDTPKVQIGQVPVPNNVSEGICSDVNLKSSLSTTPCHDSGDHSNLMTTKVPQPFTFGAKETQAIETAPQFSASEAIMEIQENEKVPQSSTSEVIKVQTVERAPQTSASELMKVQEIETYPQFSAYEAMEIQAIEMAPQSAASEAKEIQTTEMMSQSSASEVTKVQIIETYPQSSSAYEAMEIQAIEMAPQSAASEAKEIESTETVPHSCASEAKEIQATEMMPQSSASEAKEVQATENVDTKVVELEGNTKDFPTDFPGAETLELSTSEAKNGKTGDTPEDMPILENDDMTERTIDFFGGCLGPNQTEEPYVEASSKALNSSNEEIKTLLESESCPAAQEPTPMTSPSMLTLQQPSDLTEASKDIDPQTSVADTSSSIA